MSLIGRYIFRQTLFGFVVSLFTLTTLVWLTQALRQFDLLTAQGQTIGIFLLITLLVLPTFISALAPIALFIATLFTLNKLNSDNELVVMNAAGASRWRVISPFLLLSTLVGAGVLAFNTEVIPRASGQMRVLLTEAHTDMLNLMLQEGRFVGPHPKLTFHIRERGPAGELLGILVVDSRDRDETISYIADRGHIIRNDGKNFLLMENGSIQRRPPEVEKIQTVAFTRYVFDLSQFERATNSIVYRPRERTTAFLLNPDEGDPYFKASPGKFRKELHYRFSSPIYPFLLTMIAIAMVGFARTTRQNRNWAIFAAVSFAFWLRTAGFALGNLSAGSSVAVILGYIMPLVFLLVFSLIAFGVLRVEHFPWLSRLGQAIAQWTQNQLQKIRNRGWSAIFRKRDIRSADDGAVAL